MVSESSQFFAINPGVFLVYSADSECVRARVFRAELLIRDE